MNINICFCFIFICACQSTERTTPEKKEQLVQIVKKENKTMLTVDSTIKLDYLLGKFDPKADTRFITIAPKYSDRKDRLLRKETYEAFVRMQEAAKQEGVEFKILSATRNFNYQKGIWERKWTGQTKIDGEDISKTIVDPKERALKILEYSSMPGTSRHHWGTDMDLNSFDNNYFSTGRGKKEYDWLVAHAGKYGFCQPYSADRKSGYQEERWHWSYLPLAKPLTEQAGLRIKEEMIGGFLGSEQAAEIGVVNKYIMGINPDCFK